MSTKGTRAGRIQTISFCTAFIVKLLKTGEKSTKLYNTWRGSIHKDAEVSLPHVQGTEVH